MSPNEPRIALNRAAETAHPRQAEHAVDALERLRRRVLVVTTLGYIGCFAVWTIFAIIGVEIQRQYGLSDTEFGLLVGAPFLSGSLMRVVLGLWADRHGGRRLFLAVMIVAAVATWLVADATTFPTILVAGLGTGTAGGCSAVGLSTSRDGIRKNVTARRWAYWARAAACGFGALASTTSSPSAGMSRCRYGCRVI